jgi:hypothetical protein
MFEDFGYRPTIGAGPPLAVHGRDGIHRFAQGRALAIEMEEQFFRW